MGADQVAAIRPVLQELQDALVSGSPGAEDLCATFTASEDPDAWVQVVPGVVNFSYPRTEPPLELLRDARAPGLPGLVLRTFEPNAYVTFSHDPSTAEALARFVDAVLAAVHALPADYGVDTELEDISSETTSGEW